MINYRILEHPLILRIMGAVFYKISPSIFNCPTAQNVLNVCLELHIWAIILICYASVAHFARNLRTKNSKDLKCVCLSYSGWLVLQAARKFFLIGIVFWQELIKNVGMLRTRKFPREFIALEKCNFLRIDLCELSQIFCILNFGSSSTYIKKEID